MLRRKIYDYMLNWKENRKNECLIIKGARQVGKTFIIEEFGKTFDHFFEVNFLLHPELKDIFKGSLDVDDIMMRLSMFFPNAEFGESTLIFLDEIQACPEARTALKSFALDNRYYVIASGSLLGLHYGQDPELKEEIPSIPVGYEREIIMYPLDFEEFLWAKGYKEEQIGYIREFFEKEEKVPDAINEKLSELFRLFAVVGGMPAVVSCFIETGNMKSVHKTQEMILASYDDDISRHAKGPEKLKVRKCWQSIPRQLAKENKKFQFSKVESGGSARKYIDSIQWLEDASIVNLCHNVNVPLFPLKAYEDESYFKIYMLDTGLLLAMFGFEMKEAFINNTLSGPIKGGIYENIISTMLLQNGHNLYYYKPMENNQEIEFLIEKNGKIRPIEVKARNGATVSLNSFIENFHPEIAYKFIEGNIGRMGNKLSLPHYFAMFL